MQEYFALKVYILYCIFSFSFTICASISGFTYIMESYADTPFGCYLQATYSVFIISKIARRSRSLQSTCTDPSKSLCMLMKVTLLVVVMMPFPLKIVKFPPTKLFTLTCKLSLRPKRKVILLNFNLRQCCAKYVHASLFRLSFTSPAIWQIHDTYLGPCGTAATSF